MTQLSREKREEYTIDRRDLLELAREIQDVRNTFAHVREEVKRPDEKARELMEKARRILTD